ncbi:MAG: alpha/beta hydrolase [Maricaulaceae bacterium]|nr:alpha/beta hydrolase [Maricaulaceae bacterium]
MTPAGLKDAFPSAILAAFAALAVLAAFSPQAAAESAHRAETVSIPAGGTVTLSGTLTLPEGAPRAALVMITGAGPHSRDGMISGAPMFALLADALAEAGVATLRVDEAGVGDSTGERTASFFERVPHVTATLDFMRAHPALQGVPTGFYGHSEGASLAALVYAQRSEAVDFMVLAGAPGARGREVWIDQQYTLLHGQFAHMGEEVMAQTHAALSAVADASIAGGREATYAAVRALFETLQAPSHVYEDGSFEQYAGRMASAEMRDFLGYDPAPAFAKVQVPVLAVWGEIDRQTAPALNMPILVEASHAGGALTTVVLPQADHFFLFSPDLEPGQHAFGQMQLNMALPEAITGWVAALAAEG